MDERDFGLPGWISKARETNFFFLTRAAMKKTPFSHLLFGVRATFFPHYVCVAVGGNVKTSVLPIFFYVICDANGPVSLIR